MEDQAVNNQVQQEPIKPVNPKRRYLIIAGIIFVILFILGGVYTLGLLSKKPIFLPTPQSSISPTISQPSPTPVDETANWKTYQSTAIGLSFRYPADFTVNEDTTDFPEGKRNVIHIKKGDLSIQIEPFIEGALRHSKSEVTYIDNQPATMYIIDPSSNNSGLISVDINHGGSYIGYNFTISHFSLKFGKFPKKLSDNDRIFFKKFLSTVKFMDQNQTTCNTNTDCKSGETCTTTGPIVANQPPKKVCVPQGQVAPL